MSRPLVDQIADAVLYEGYLLYPYRPSVKNRQRWTFGGLFPRSYSEAQGGSDPWSSQTQCLVRARRGTRLSVRVRFLHLQLRRVEGAGPDPAAGPSTWQEAVERSIDLPEYSLASLVRREDGCFFAELGHRDEEPANGPGGGTVIRERQAITGSALVSAERLGDSLVKVTVRVSNDSPLPESSLGDRDAAQLRSFASTHAILGVRKGEFVSMIDPPEDCREHAAGCQNIGTWPVLVGDPGSLDTMLSAPIILYDYPQIAPESPGDLFDATEIDEILTLRILTLTEDEKRAMCATDDRARALLERTESLSRDQLMGLHGSIRGLRPEGGQR